MPRVSLWSHKTLCKWPACEEGALALSTCQCNDGDSDNDRCDAGEVCTAKVCSKLSCPTDGSMWAGAPAELYGTKCQCGSNAEDECRIGQICQVDADAVSYTHLTLPTILRV